MSVAAERCVRPGCDGEIEDGYCNVCGMARVGTTPAAGSPGPQRRRGHERDRGHEWDLGHERHRTHGTRARPGEAGPHRAAGISERV